MVALRLLLLAVLTFGLVLPAGSAWAQTEGELSVARKFYQAGLDHEKNKRWQEALDSYEKALAIKSTPQLNLRAAICHENLGHLAQALVAYERSLEQAKLANNTDVVAVVGERLGALKPRVPSITIAVAKRSELEGLVVQLDDETVASAIVGVPIPVDPGTHEIVVSATGHKRSRREVTLEEGDAEAVDVVLEVDEGAPPEKAPVEPPATIDTPNYVPGAVVLGVGAAALGVGIALFIVQSGIESDVDDLCGGEDRLLCPSDREGEVRDDLDSAETLRITSFVVGGVGAAAVIAGVVLLVVPPTENTDVALLPGAPGSDFGLTGRIRF